MKKNFIYIVRTQSDVFEAIFRGEIRDVFLWEGLPFSNTPDAPKFTPKLDIVWQEEICPWHDMLSRDNYERQRSKVVTAPSSPVTH